MFVRFLSVFAVSSILAHYAHGNTPRARAIQDEKQWAQILGSPSPSDTILKTPAFLGAIQTHLRHFYGDMGNIKHLSEKQQQLVRLYQNRDFKPLWLTRGGWGNTAKTAIDVLKNADREGLDPADYNTIIERIKITPLDANNTNQMAELERSLTAAVLDYIDDLAGERLVPHKVNGQLFIKPAHIDAGLVLETGLSRDVTGGFLNNLTVEFPTYQLLKKELARLKSLQNQDQWPVNLTLPWGKKKLVLGDRGPAVTILKEQLTAHGLLKNAAPDIFDNATENAVKTYQQNHTLEPDGVVGNETVTSLNTSVSDRIDQVIVTMERWRWVPDPLPARIIMVNIAGYTLQGFDHGQEILSMPVIIGQKYRKTPVFTSEIDIVRYNPSWYVPHSIAVRDKLPTIQKDPGYLTRKGFVVTDSGGNTVDPHSINWSSVSADNFGYKFRQNPGAMNALGKLFFHINTPFDVFLHSTPDQDLFKKTKRSLSSGCIRVERPADLAFFVLNEPSIWPLKTIEAAMAGNQTKDVILSHKTPVYIGYFTVYPGSDGMLKYGEDFYGQDAAILKALKDKRQKMRLS